ncbi:MAG: ABC transporter ATP-binding protein [Chloroflexi bacterium]|nr:ABC transporter ATP-binding protein [Chloroflexota bacterium]
MIELRQVTKRYGLTTFGVRNLNFDIRDQEFLVIYGPAGAGKTTTLRLIAGITRPTEGDIVRDGESLLDVSPENRDMAFAFENYALYSHMSVYDNLAFPLKARGMSRSEIEERVQRIGRVLQIGDLLERRPGFLSGGQRQRVSLGRAIIRPANLYLLDEPIGHLDAKLRHRMRGELKAMSADLNATIALVTTSSREALALGDRIAILKNGVLEQIGTPQEVYDCPANEFVASFVGEPPMSFLDIEPCQEDGQRLFKIKDCTSSIGIPGRLAASLNGETSGYRLGVRATEITLARQEDATHRVPAEVYYVEHMGYTNIVSVKLGGGLLSVVTDPTTTPSMQQSVWLDLDAEHMHLFYKQKASVHPSRTRAQAAQAAAEAR